MLKKHFVHLSAGVLLATAAPQVSPQLRDDSQPSDLPAVDSAQRRRDEPPPHAVRAATQPSPPAAGRPLHCCVLLRVQGEGIRSLLHITHTLSSHISFIDVPDLLFPRVFSFYQHYPPFSTFPWSPNQWQCRCLY